jgi:hypothetical protein
MSPRRNPEDGFHYTQRIVIEKLQAWDAVIRQFDGEHEHRWPLRGDVRHWF